MIIGIDHVLIAVEDLDQAVEDYQQLGFRVLRGGQHPGRGTYNALVPLADGAYLELIGLQNRELAEQRSAHIIEALKRENRLVGFALESNDLAADVAAIRARGLAIGEPIPGERIRPDGQRAAWHTARVGESALPFLIQDQTPRELRVPAAAEGISRMLGVADVVFGARDVEAAHAEFAKLLGIEAQDGQFELARGGIQLERNELEDGLLRVVLAADNPGALAEQWREQGVAFRETVIEGVGLILEPSETAGAPISIVAQPG